MDQAGGGWGGSRHAYPSRSCRRCHAACVQVDFFCLHPAILFIFIYRAAECPQLQSNGRMSVFLVHLLECVCISESAFTLCVWLFLCILYWAEVCAQVYFCLFLCVCVSACVCVSLGFLVLWAHISLYIVCVSCLPARLCVEVREQR